MTTVDANGVTLGVEHFGDARAPLVLLAGGTTMLSWPDALCAALARGGRHVVRYDLRDSGASILGHRHTRSVISPRRRGACPRARRPAGAPGGHRRRRNGRPGRRARLDCKPRWRERLPALTIPALVVHGRRNRFFPVGNGEALAREIPDARLLVLERAATAIPDVAAEEVAAAMLEL
jgi:pimeloyl-ACP methyl ester carboxylesterase